MKGTENKPKLNKALECCMKLKGRQGLVGVAAKSFGQEMIKGFNDERTEIIKCVRANVSNLNRYNTNAKEQSDLKIAKNHLKNPSSKYSKLQHNEKKKIESGLDKKIQDKEKILKLIQREMNTMKNDLEKKLNQFQNKYGVPHDNNIDLPNFE